MADVKDKKKTRLPVITDRDARNTENSPPMRPQTLVCRQQEQCALCSMESKICKTGMGYHQKNDFEGERH